MTTETVIILECFRGQSYPLGKPHHNGCGHKWAERFELPMLVDAVVARVEEISHCPKCGNSKDTMMLRGERYKAAYKEILGVEPPEEGSHA